MNMKVFNAAAFFMISGSPTAAGAKSVLFLKLMIKSVNFIYETAWTIALADHARMCI